MRAQFIRGKDPIETLGGIGERLMKKFKLNAFQKELSKYNKEYLEEKELDDYAEDQKSDWHYFWEIGQVIGSVIDNFYPYKESKDPEWGEKYLPSDPKNSDQFHPAFVRIINYWIQKEFPDWTDENISQFWEGITDQMQYR